MKRRLVGFLFVILIAVCLFGGLALTASAKCRKESVKCFAKVKVEYGDTLWSIAEDYYSDEYRSMNDLIDEIKSSNHIYSDNIYAGDIIIVPYFN